VDANALERSGHCLLEIIFYDCMDGLRIKHINLIKGSQCSGGDVNLTLSPKTSVDCCRYTNLLILASQDKQVEGQRNLRS